MMAHRATVRDALAQMPKETETPEEPQDNDNGLPPMRTVLIVAGVFAPLALLLLGLQVRRWFKRKM
jgi:hypothetical protein